MSNLFRQLMFGVGSVILAPANLLPQPGLRITIPPKDSQSAIARDFGMVGHDLTRSLRQREQANQLLLDV